MPDMPDESRKDTFRSIYDDTTFFIDNIIDEYDVYPTIIEKMRSGNATMELRKRYFLRAIDETWVNAVEEVLPALDVIIRNPSKFIEEKEELIPVELARKVTVRTLQHLSQHTNYIQSIKGDEITPSMLLNVYKDETLQTYENKFINTLINRLYMFVNRRYEIALKAGQDEKTTSIDFKENFTHDKIKVKMDFRIEISEPSNGLGDKVERNYSYTTELWHRVEKLNSIVSSFAASDFCQQMGHSYIRPPVMRTNAIMKNKNLHQCYELWQFIETYDSAGYSMLLQENLENIDEGYIKEIYSTLAIQYMLFRYNIRNEFDFDSTLASSLTNEELKPHIVSELNKTSEHEFDVDELPQEQEKTAKTPSEVRYSTMTPDDRIILESLDVAMAADAIINDRDEDFLYSRGDIPEPEAIPDTSPKDDSQDDEPEDETEPDLSTLPGYITYKPIGADRYKSGNIFINRDSTDDYTGRHNTADMFIDSDIPDVEIAKADADTQENVKKDSEQFDYDEIIRQMHARIDEANAIVRSAEEQKQEQSEISDASGANTESPSENTTPESGDTEKAVSDAAEAEEPTQEPQEKESKDKESKDREFLSNLKFPFENKSEDTPDNDKNN